MPSQKRIHELSQVKKLVQEFLNGDIRRLWFSARSRSINIVMQILGCLEKEAVIKITQGVLKLEDKDFSDNNTQWGMTNDIYGLENYEGHNWYVKFNISKENDIEYVNNLSFHPVEFDLLVKDGRLLKVTYFSQKEMPNE